MSFLDKLKRDIYNEESRRGLRNQVIVRTRPLLDLIDHYEKMDSFARSQSDMHASLEHKLSNVLHALYCETHDSERLMLLIMKILKPMIKARIKEDTINSVYERQY